jgi:putative copper export protein
MIALEAAISALCYIALALFFGQLVVAGLLLPADAPKNIRRALLAGANTALLLFLAAAIVALIVQGAKLQRGFPSAELLWRYLTLAQSGRVWLAREIYGAALVIFICVLMNKEVGRNGIRWAAILAIPLVASRSLASHAAAVRDATLQMVGVDALHLIVTAFWAGGVMALWRILRLNGVELRQSSDIVQRFSRLALISVAALALTGLYQAWVHVGSVDALANTAYGKTLALKFILFSAMLSVGAVNFLSTKRLLARAAIDRPNDLTARRIAARRVGIEGVIALLIFFATGLLTVLPPGVHAVHRQSAPLPPPAIKSEIANQKRYLPADGASLKIIEPKAGQVFTADRVALKFTLSRGKRGHHVHAYVDGELMGMFEGKAGTLNGINPGKHVLELRVAADDHTTELDASDKVEFTVR